MYLFISFLCSAVTEGLSRLFSTRAKVLKLGIEQLLDDPDDALQRFHLRAQDVLRHPLVNTLKEPPSPGLFKLGTVFQKIGDGLGGEASRLPSYVPSSVVRSAVVE